MKVTIPYMISNQNHTKTSKKNHELLSQIANLTLNLKLSK